MVSHDNIKAANFISSTSRLIEEIGVTIETGSDFAEYRNFVMEQPLRGQIIPSFDSAKTNIEENEGFWIIGRDVDGEIVHTQAVKIVDLGAETLASYIDSHRAEFTPSEWVYDSKNSKYEAAPDTCSIVGTVCCHGEFWIKGGPKGFRNTGLTVLGARLGMAVSLMKWSPDYLFALMQSLTICKGLAARAGFMHTAQTNLYWRVPGYTENLEVWSAWVSREDIKHLISISPDKLCQQLNGQSVRVKRAVVA